MTMVRTFIGMGSNLGNRRANILSAWKTLTDKCSTRIEGISSPYLSEPVGIDSENWFINAVGIMNTELHPAGLLTEMLAIETAMGRDRTRSDDRIIDLDLLYYDDLVLEEENLIVPHSGIADRLFVLLPLTEVAPEYRHPVFARTSSEMLKLINSKDVVKKTSWNPEEI